MTSRFVRVSCIVALAALGSQCGGSSDMTGTSQPVIQKAATASGDNQSAAAGTALTSPLRVAVTLSGVPQQGSTVTWAAAGSDGSVTPTTAVTDVNGIATTAWTLGQTSGSQHATASLAGATGTPVTFTASATPGPATQLALTAGDNQADAPNSTLSGPLKVKAGDQFGNGVSGVTVAWQVTSGTATVQAASSATDAGGIAQTGVSLGGTLGPVTITATSAGLTGSPVTFHATVVSFPASASVQVGDNFFKSGRNSTTNPAVDTIAVGGTVTWTWGGVNNHSVRSTGTPSFTSSSIVTSGTYSFTFATAGTYTYDCAVHGALMSGTIVVK
jgi:plastocyanin